MNLGTYLKSEIVVFVPGLNSNVLFCVVKIGSIFKEGSLWTPPLRTRPFPPFQKHPERLAIPSASNSRPQPLPPQQVRWARLGARHALKIDVFSPPSRNTPVLARVSSNEYGSPAPAQRATALLSLLSREQPRPGQGGEFSPRASRFPRAGQTAGNSTPNCGELRSV